MSLPYDKNSAESIVKYARLLLGKSLIELHPEARAFKGKGGLGQAVEKYHFEYDPNSIDEPDFREAGLELKCTPLKQIADGSMVPKERLVLNMINYFTEAVATYETSSFMKKNKELLLMFHLFMKGQNSVRDIFKIVRTWKIPEEDSKIFKDDWNKIHSKILAGKAEDIGESDSFYLAACTKSSNSSIRRKQPNSEVLVKPRAYSLKPPYVKYIIYDSYINHPEYCNGLYLSPVWQKKFIQSRESYIAKSLSDYHDNETLEDLVRRRFVPYYGMSVGDIANLLGISYSENDKALAARVCYAILNVKKGATGYGETGIAEFDKAGVIMKTIRLEENGSLKESMSFPYINYNEIVNEKWEDSDWYSTVNSKFFFVVLRKRSGMGNLDVILEDSFFWNMPQKDVKIAEQLWRDTKEKIKEGNYGDFWRLGDHHLFHIRPHGKNANDVVETPQRTFEIKRCFWFNAEYVLDIVNQHRNH